MLPGISARGHRALGGIHIPIYVRGFLFVQLQYMPYSCGLYGCTSHKVSDHTCKVFVYGSCCDMLHSEVL